MHIHTNRPNPSNTSFYLKSSPKLDHLSLGWDRTEFMRTAQKFSGELRRNSFISQNFIESYFAKKIC